MSFNITAGNTGHKREQKLGKDFIWLACHHHKSSVSSPFVIAPV